MIEAGRKEGGEEVEKKVVCGNGGRTMSVAMEQQTPRQTSPWWKWTRKSRYTWFHKTASEMRNNGGRLFEREEEGVQKTSKKQKKAVGRPWKKTISDEEHMT